MDSKLGNAVGYDDTADWSQSERADWQARIDAAQQETEEKLQRQIDAILDPALNTMRNLARCEGCFAILSLHEIANFGSNMCHYCFYGEDLGHTGASEYPIEAEQTMGTMRYVNDIAAPLAIDYLRRNRRGEHAV